MSLPVSRDSIELTPRMLTDRYAVMSVSPLEYKPYMPHDGAIPLGYAGVASSPGGLVVASRLAHYDTATSFDMMRSWLTPALTVCLPESPEYPDDLLDEVTGKAKDNEPIALFLLEDEGQGDRRISLAASKSLGRASIEEKAEKGLKPSAQETKGIQRFMSKDRLDARAAFGEENYESLVVGGALMLRLFELKDPQISMPSQQTISR